MMATVNNNLSTMSKSYHNLIHIFKLLYLTSVSLFFEIVPRHNADVGSTPFQTIPRPNDNVGLVHFLNSSQAQC